MLLILNWSGREDLNLRPPGPEPDLRHAEEWVGWKRFGINDLETAQIEIIRCAPDAAYVSDFRKVQQA